MDTHSFVSRFHTEAASPSFVTSRDALHLRLVAATTSSTGTMLHIYDLRVGHATLTRRLRDSPLVPAHVTLERPGNNPSRA